LRLAQGSGVLQEKSFEELSNLALALGVCEKHLDAPERGYLTAQSACYEVMAKRLRSFTERRRLYEIFLEEDRKGQR
jgi:hypothetical protein